MISALQLKYLTLMFVTLKLAASSSVICCKKTKVGCQQKQYLTSAWYPFLSLRQAEMGACWLFLLSCLPVSSRKPLHFHFCLSSCDWLAGSWYWPGWGLHLLWAHISFLVVNLNIENWPCCFSPRPVSLVASLLTLLPSFTTVHRLQQLDVKKIPNGCIRERGKTVLQAGAWASFLLLKTSVAPYYELNFLTPFCTTRSCGADTAFFNLCLTVGSCCQIQNRKFWFSISLLLLCQEQLNHLMQREPKAALGCGKVFSWAIKTESLLFHFLTSSFRLLTFY